MYKVHVIVVNMSGVGLIGGDGTNPVGEHVDTPGSDYFARNLDLPPFPQLDADYIPPNVNLLFHLGPHRSSAHFAPIDSLLKQSDVYVSEGVGWNDETLATVARIAKGNEKLFRINQPNMPTDYHKGWLKAIYGSYKTIAFVDADVSQTEITTKTTLAMYLGSITDDTEETLNGLADVIAKDARRAAMRDRVILERLGPRVTEAVVGHPKLRAKPSVSVLCTYGANHQDVYLQLIEPLGDRVSGAYFAYNPNNDVGSAAVNSFKEKGYATRDQLTTFLIGLALDQISVPGLGGRKLTVAQFGSPEDQVHRLARATMDQMVADSSNSAALAIAVLNNRLSDNQTSQLLGYINNATNLLSVADE